MFSEHYYYGDNDVLELKVVFGVLIFFLFDNF